MKIILLGAPGAGKGTQAEFISNEFKIPIIGTGECLRRAISNKTPLGEKVKTYMNGGNLVPDELVIDIIKQRISEDDCANGFILDGFPRTLVQAEELESMGVRADVALAIEVSDETIIERMAGRRVCTACNTSYHTEYNPPGEDGICDKCGNPLAVRDDDKPETVRNRLLIYHDKTEPIKAYYEKMGILKEVIGQEKLSDTTALVRAALAEEGFR